MRPLWNRLFIVGFGEFQDSSFPSLGVGATQTLFEELWSESQTLSAEGARAESREALCSHQSVP